MAYRIHKFNAELKGSLKYSILNWMNQTSHTDTYLFKTQSNTVLSSILIPSKGLTFFPVIYLL